MSKVIIQALISCAVFLAVLFGFAQVDWLSVLQLNNGSLEKKLGDIYWDFYRQQGDYMEDEELLLPIDSLVEHICTANDIDREDIKLHLLKTEDVNAFALPDKHLVIHSALVLECKNEMELCGVIAHEIAHMQKGHVMRKLTKSVGLSVLLNMAGFFRTSFRVGMCTYPYGKIRHIFFFIYPYEKIRKWFRIYSCIH